VERTLSRRVRVEPLRGSVLLRCVANSGLVLDALAFEEGVQALVDVLEARCSERTRFTLRPLWVSSRVMMSRRMPRVVGLATSAGGPQRAWSSRPAPSRSTCLPPLESTGSGPAAGPCAGAPRLAWWHLSDVEEGKPVAACPSRRARRRSLCPAVLNASAGMVMPVTMFFSSHWPGCRSSGGRSAGAAAPGSP
jgi:hypothetical protein